MTTLLLTLLALAISFAAGWIFAEACGDDLGWHLRRVVARVRPGRRRR